MGGGGWGLGAGEWGVEEEGERNKLKCLFFPNYYLNLALLTLPFPSHNNILGSPRGFEMTTLIRSPVQLKTLFSASLFLQLGIYGQGLKQGRV